MKTETGGGNTASCVHYMCNVIPFLNANSDGESRNPCPTRESRELKVLVYVGYVGRAAGEMLRKSFSLLGILSSQTIG